MKVVIQFGVMVDQRTVQVNIPNVSNALTATERKETDKPKHQQTTDQMPFRLATLIKNEEIAEEKTENQESRE